MINDTNGIKQVVITVIMLIWVNFSSVVLFKDGYNGSFNKNVFPKITQKNNNKNSHKSSQICVLKNKQSYFFYKDISSHNKINNTTHYNRLLNKLVTIPIKMIESFVSNLNIWKRKKENKYFFNFFPSKHFLFFFPIYFKFSSYTPYTSVDYIPIYCQLTYPSLLPFAISTTPLYTYYFYFFCWKKRNNKTFFLFKISPPPSNLTP